MNKPAFRRECHRQESQAFHEAMDEDQNRANVFVYKWERKRMQSVSIIGLDDDVVHFSF